MDDWQELAVDLEDEDDERIREYRTYTLAALGRCDALLAHNEEIMELLANLEKGFLSVMEQTKPFQETCRDLMQEQEKATRLADDIATNLTYFDSLESIVRRLNAPGTELVLQPDFQQMLLRLDACLAYMEAHMDFKNAELYAQRYRQCMTRSLVLIRLYFVGTLRRLSTEVQKRISAKPLTDVTLTAVLYAKFKLDAPTMAGLVEEIKARSVDNEEYRNILNDCYSCLFGIRIRLIGPLLKKQLNELSGEKKLLEFARAAFAPTKTLCEDEFELFLSYFPSGADGMYDCLKAICQPLYEAMNTRIAQESDREVLIGLCSLLDSYFEDSDNEVEQQFGNNLSAAPPEIKFDFALLLEDMFRKADARVNALSRQKSIS